MTAGATVVGETFLTKQLACGTDACTDIEQHANSMACVAEHMQLVLNGATFNASQSDNSLALSLACPARGWGCMLGSSHDVGGSDIDEL